MFGLFKDSTKLLTASGRIARIGVNANMDSPTHFLVAIEGCSGIFRIKAQYRPAIVEGNLELAKPGDLLTVEYVECAPGEYLHQVRSYTNHSMVVDAGRNWRPASTTADGNALTDATPKMSLRDELSYRTHQRLTTAVDPHEVLVMQPPGTGLIPHSLVAGPSGAPEQH